MYAIEAGVTAHVPCQVDLDAVTVFTSSASLTVVDGRRKEARDDGATCMHDRMRWREPFLHDACMMHDEMHDEVRGDECTTMHYAPCTKCARCVHAMHRG